MQIKLSDAVGENSNNGSSINEYRNTAGTRTDLLDGVVVSSNSTDNFCNVRRRAHKY